MKKALKFYLVASTIMSSMALAGTQEQLEELDRRGLQIALKGIIEKFRFPKEEFDVNNPLDKERLDKVYHFIDAALSDKLRGYHNRRVTLSGGNQHPDYQKLATKYSDYDSKQSTLSMCWSELFCEYAANNDSMSSTGVASSSSSAPMSSTEAASSSSGQCSSWFKEYGIDEFDEVTLKAAVQVLLNRREKDTIYGSLFGSEDTERKEKVESLLKGLSQKKDILSSAEKKRKILLKIEGLEKQLLPALEQRVLKTKQEIEEAESQRKQKKKEFEKRRHDLPLKLAAEEMLSEIHSLKGSLLDQIRKDHEALKRLDKGDIAPDASLNDAIIQYNESAMSITKVMKENEAAKNLFEKMLEIFPETENFELAIDKICKKAEDLGYPLEAHFYGVDHSYFPYFERLTSLFCQLIDDPTNLIYSQQFACTNGLYGRIVFNILIALEEKLDEGIKSPSQLPVAFSEAPYNVTAFEEGMRQIQQEDDASRENYLRLCQKQGEEEGTIEDTKKEIKNLYKMAEIEK